VRARRVLVEKLAATHGPTTFACPTLSIVSSARSADVRPDFNWDKKPVRSWAIPDALVARLQRSALPDGRMLRTLRDAGEYIQELPRATHQRPEWKIAAEMLLEAVEGKGPLMFAEIAMHKAVNAGKPAPEPMPRRRGRR
jgi:hypothetical protein